MSGLSGIGLLIYNAALGSVFAVGLLGNCLVIGVILRQRSGTRSPTSIYLANLALADALHLLSIPPLIHTSIANYWAWSELACKVYYLLFYMNSTMSVYIITAMSFDRYKAVVSPFTSAGLRNKRFASIILVALWITGALVISPVCLYAHIDELYNATHCTHSQMPPMEDANETEPVPDDLSDRMRSFFTHPAYFIRYIFVTGCVLPGLMLICFYSLIVHKLYMMKLARNSSGQARQRFEKVTLLVGAVVAFYVVCCLPHWVHVNVSLSVSGHSYWLVVSSHITALLGYISSAGNPVLYAFLNDPFRASLREFLSINGPAGAGGAGGALGAAGAGGAAGGAAGAAAVAGGAAGAAVGLISGTGGAADAEAVATTRQLLSGSVGTGGIFGGGAVVVGGGGGEGSPTMGLTTYNVTSMESQEHGKEQSAV